MSGRPDTGKHAAVSAGIATLLAVATLGQGGGSALSLLLWHGLLLLILLATLARAPRETDGAWSLPAGPLVTFGLFSVLAAAGAVLAPYGYAAWLVGLEIAAFGALLVLSARVGPGLLDRLVGPLLAVACLHGVFVIYQRTAVQDVRPASTFLNTNHLSGWLVAVLLLAAGSAAGRRGRRAGTLGLALAGPAALAVLMSGSRGALLGAGVGLLWLGLARWRRLTPRTRRVAGVVALVMLVLFAWRVARRLQDRDPFHYHRLKIWSASVEVLRDDPWWGSGPGQFAVAALWAGRQPTMASRSSS